MNMLTLLSWKNIWRSKKRSLVVIGSIAVGVWALVFLFSFLNSFNEGYIRNAIRYDYSHIQIHHPDYRLDPNLQYYLEDRATIYNMLDTIDEVQAYSGRVLVNGMIATGRSNQGVELVGIDPDRENAATALQSSLIEGAYFVGNRNTVLIGKDLAEKLGAKIRSKVVLTFLDVTGSITSAAFRIEGIFESKSPRINKTTVYVKMDKLQGLAQLDQIHEIAVLLKENKWVEPITESLSKNLSGREVLAYNKLAPEFELLKQQSQVSKQILTAIIMLALLFGIINTMLMAVLERTRELGMLRAVGMHKSSVFIMILFETTFLSLVGGPVGIVLGIFTVMYFGHSGLDLSSYSETLESYGFDTVFYPVLEHGQYPILMLVVMATALVGSVYPAMKAIKLNPLEALRNF